MKENKAYPKILIIGNYLNLHWGGGITLYNLLKGWPKDNIAIAANKIDQEGLDICTTYYRLGFDEYKRPWPLHKFQPMYTSGEVELQPTQKKEDLSEYQFKPSKYNRSRKLKILNLLHWLGIYYYLFPLKVTPKFINWVKKVNPDIIYTQLSMPELIWFHQQLLQKVDLPLVIHIMDDWPKIINKPGLSNLYWNPRIQQGFKSLLKKSAGLMSICQHMSNEYKKRYGHDFTPFHNCIDLEVWSAHAKTSWDVTGKFSVLYAGRIGKGTSQSLLSVAKAIEKLGNEGVNIEFQLQCRTIPDELKPSFSTLKHTIINDFLSYEELPKKFSSVDMLVLPMDFDKENLDFIHLSMPTKVPEYMATGTPILVFTDASTALYHYAHSDNWAFTVKDNSIDVLAHEIKKIFNDQSKRKEIGATAKKIASLNHGGKKVREEFRAYLANIKKE